MDDATGGPSCRLRKRSRSGGSVQNIVEEKRKRSAKSKNDKGSLNQSSDHVETTHNSSPGCLKTSANSSGRATKSTPSSSLALHDFNHPLIYSHIKNIKDLAGTVSSYNLVELFDNFDDSNCGPNPQAGRDEVRVKLWIENVASKCELSGLNFTADKSVEAFLHCLVPFLASTRNRSDVAVLKKFGKWNIPVLLLEVHSGTYMSTVCKTAASVIDQLRVLRCFNPDVHECSGFTFPKSAEKKFVTEVQVTFTDLKFNVQLKLLQKESVKDKIVAILRKNVSYTLSSPSLCFIRLSEAEIKMISDELGTSGSVVQKQSMHSIVLYDDYQFIKYTADQWCSSNLQKLKLKITGSKHVSLCSKQSIVSDLHFFSFPKLLPPLHQSKAIKCLKQFVLKTATALQELHGFGFAHLDVRLPNICFAEDSSGYYVKLIDLDRCMKATASTDLKYKGEMYIMPTTWSMGQLDWKQLGLEIVRIITDFKKTDEGLVKIFKTKNLDHGNWVNDQCLQNLILEGVWNEEYCRVSTVIPDDKTLDEVLEDR